MRTSENKLRKAIRQVLKEESSDQELLDKRFSRVLASEIKLQDFIKNTVGDSNREFYENVYARAFYVKYEEMYRSMLSFDERAHIRSLLRTLMTDFIEKGRAGNKR